MHQPSLSAVDRIDHAGAPWIDGAGAPGAFVLLAMKQIRRADIGRLHSLDYVIAGKLCADGPAYDGARAVASNQKAAIHPPDAAAVKIAKFRACRGIADNHGFNRGPVDNANA